MARKKENYKEIVHLLIRLPKGLHKRFKAYAVSRGVSMRELLTTFIKSSV